jgi:hypothetical protein
MYLICLVLFFVLSTLNPTIGKGQEEDEQSLPQVNSRAVPPTPARQPTVDQPLCTVEFLLDYPLPPYPPRDISHIEIVTNTGYSQKVEWDLIKEGVKSHVLADYPVYNLGEELQIWVIVISTNQEHPIWQEHHLDSLFPIIDGNSYLFRIYLNLKESFEGKAIAIYEELD